MLRGNALRLIPPLVLAAISLVALPAEAQTFGPTVNVSNTRSDSSAADMAVSGSSVYLVWTDQRGPLFSRSNDSGGTFSAGLLVFSGAGNTATQVAAAGANVYMARSDRPNGKKPSQVYFRRSTDGGTTFGSQIQISAASLVAGAFFEAMAASGNNVYIVWRQWVGSWQVFFARSGDGGATFGTPVTLSATTGNEVSSINVVADDPNVHVAWSEDFGGGTSAIFYTRSTDGGTSFPYGRINVSNNVVATNVFPVLAASGSSVYLAWRAHAANDNVPHMYFNRSADTGASFVGPSDLSGAVSDTLHIGDGPSPQLAVSGSDVHVIWHANPGGNYDVFYRASHDSGANFVGGASNISTPYGAPNFSPTPVIAANGGNVYITWSGGASSTARDVFMAHSGDSGASFLAVNVSNTPGDSGGPVTVATSTGIHAAWLDSTPGNSDVFYRRGTP